jgi:hypothetical protein
MQQEDLVRQDAHIESGKSLLSNVPFISEAM